MTRFSVVVPVRSAEPYVDECLRSVRGQAGLDLEIIAVDDASPDRCAGPSLRVRRGAHGSAARVVGVLEQGRPPGLRRRGGPSIPAGHYEDFAWSITALLAAGRVAVSDRVGVRFRRCRSTSISRGTSPRHLEVLDRIERILAFLAARPEHDSAEIRDVLTTGMRTFLRSRSERLRVVPSELLDEFRRRSVEVTARMGDRV